MLEQAVGRIWKEGDMPRVGSVKDVDRPLEGPRELSGSFCLSDLYLHRVGALLLEVGGSPELESFPIRRCWDRPSVGEHS